MRWKQNAGQAATESMMVISVVTLAVVAAGYAFVPMFESGVKDLSNDVAAILELGDIGGNGGGGGGGNGAGGSGSENSSSSGADRSPDGSAGTGVGNNADNTRNGYFPAFASAAPGNDAAGSIPNQGPGNQGPLGGQAPIGESNSVLPGNDTDPVITEGDGAWVNRGALGAAAAIPGASERGFGSGPGAGP